MAGLNYLPRLEAAVRRPRHLFRLLQAPCLCVAFLLIPVVAGAPILARDIRSSATQVANDEHVAPPSDTPESERWPDETNTGVPADVTLTPSGDLVITKAGAVVSGLDILGTVQINAPNVTLKNCKVTAANWSVVKIATGVTGTVVQNCEINGRGSSGADGSCGINGEGTFLNNNIYNVENGINVTGSSSIQGNYIHGLLAPGSPHYDGIQIDGGVSNVNINHNTIINDHGQVSAVMIDNGFGAISNIVVENNRLIGGGFTVYSDGQFRDAVISGVAFINNRLRKGYWGYHSFVKNAPVWRGNVDDRTSRPLVR
jgi:hypothetical protein